MGTTVREPVADGGYSYAAVEDAFAIALKVAPADRGSLRGRITNFRRFGFGPSGRPGPGLPIRYTREDATRWLVALQLERLLMTPANAVDLVSRHWTPKPSSLIKPRETLAFQCDAARKGRTIFVVIAFWPDRAPSLGFADGSVKLGNMLASERSHTGPDGATIFDLTTLLRTFDTALDEASQ